MVDWFFISESAGRWYCVEPSGQKRGPYRTREAAAAAARDLNEYRAVTGSATTLARIYTESPIIPVTLLRMGFVRLGHDKLHDLLLTSDQERQVNHYRLYLDFAAANDATPKPEPGIFRRHRALLEDLLNTVPWDDCCNQLSGQCGELIGALARLMVDPDRLLDGAAAWQWAGAVVGVMEPDVGRQLDSMLARDAPKSADLTALSVAKRSGGEFAPGVHLAAHCIQAHHVTDLTSRPAIRRQLLEIFRPDGDVLTDINDEIETCRRAAHLVIQLSKSAPAGKYRCAAGMAAMFLGFDALSGLHDVDLKKLLSSTRSGSRPAATRNRCRSGPSMIEYARCSLSARSVWDRAPLGSIVLSAQGQTRSPKGHRA